MTLTYPEIHTLAERYAREYNSHKLTPFPFDNITAHHDVEIIYFDPEDSKVSGVILYDDKSDKFSILINSTKRSSHQHFTLAHEFGHYFLHSDTLKKEKVLVDGDLSLDDSTLASPQGKLEIEANHFATNLLMPARLVEEAWDVFHNIEKCAKLFKVSAVVMSIRLTELKLVS